MVSGDHLVLVGGVDWTAPNPDIIAINLATRHWSRLHLTPVRGHTQPLLAIDLWLERIEHKWGGGGGGEGQWSRCCAKHLPVTSCL